MTGSELSVLACGIGLLFAYGAFHMAGIELIRRCKPRQDKHPYLGVLLTFWGLAILHLMEIGIGALTLAALLAVPGFGSLSSGFGSSATDHIYFAGVSFGTLGYTDHGGPWPHQAARHDAIAQRIHADHLVGDLHLHRLGRELQGMTAQPGGVIYVSSQAAERLNGQSIA